LEIFEGKETKPPEDGPKNGKKNRYFKSRESQKHDSETINKLRER
jgi:hypothetical protein